MIQALLPFPHIDPVLVHLGPLRHPLVCPGLYRRHRGWAGGAWCGSCARRNFGRHPPFNGKPPATEDDIGDLVVWATFGVILGGRLGWVLIYGTILCSVTPQYAAFCDGLPMGFLTDPIRIIAAWEGGMSFHGGLARRGAGGLAVLPPAQTEDAAGGGSGLRLCAHRPVLRPPRQFRQWRIVGPRHRRALGDDLPARSRHLPRHPSQFYEAALEGVVLFVILQIALRVFRAHERPGLLSALFFLGYGTFRFICEFFREPDTQFIGPVSMGMALSIPVWLGAGALFWLAYHKPVAKAA